MTSGHCVPVYLHFSVCFFRSDSTERPSYRMFPMPERRPSIKHRRHQNRDITVPPEKLHQVGGLSPFVTYIFTQWHLVILSVQSKMNVFTLGSSVNTSGNNCLFIKHFQLNNDDPPSGASKTGFVSQF